MEKNFPERKPTRLPCFDYSKEGIYFLTICTHERKEILSKIIFSPPVGGDVLDAPFCDVPSHEQFKVVLTDFGVIADKHIKQINLFYDDINITDYVIMPNHIHILLHVHEHFNCNELSEYRQHSRVSQFVSTFKRFCNKDYGTNIWQRHFFDHIIRDREDLENHINYIKSNPMNWNLDELNSIEK